MNRYIPSWRLIILLLLLPISFRHYKIWTCVKSACVLWFNVDVDVDAIVVYRLRIFRNRQTVSKNERTTMDEKNEKKKLFVKILCQISIDYVYRLLLCAVWIEDRQREKEWKLIDDTGTVFLSTQLHCGAIITVRTTNQLESIQLSHMIYFSVPMQHNCLYERERSGWVKLLLSLLFRFLLLLLTLIGF